MSSVAKASSIRELDEIFSTIIVNVDYYLTKPVSGLDPNYTKFRGHEIEKVPVIRLFGINKINGEKILMHIHGVLPYFYIPYESTLMGDIDKTLYQIAESIDKALNISLGQISSTTKHVYKVQLVKGTPFYGHHHREHQFLKIFLYNPRLIKRIAKLFENGAILGKIFQLYEAHIPYILQFFIDYNLYGMGCLNVQKSELKHRAPNKNQKSLINDLLLKEDFFDYTTPERISKSKLEVDIIANSILNRLEKSKENRTNSNPGIEAIWEDERRRRKKIFNSFDNCEMLELEIPPSQDRINVRSTENEEFFKKELREKINRISEEPSTSQDKKSQKSKFNLRNLLNDSVYPEECSQDLSVCLTSASVIQDHLSFSTLALSPPPLTKSSPKQLGNRTYEKASSVVNQKLIKDLNTKNKLNESVNDETLNSEDYEVLKILQKLEEYDNKNNIDLDSALAAPTILSLSQKKLNETMKPPTQTETMSKKKENKKNDDEEDIASTEEEDDDKEEQRYMNDTFTPKQIEQLQNGIIEIEDDTETDDEENGTKTKLDKNSSCIQLLKLELSDKFNAAKGGEAASSSTASAENKSKTINRNRGQENDLKSNIRIRQSSVAVQRLSKEEIEKLTDTSSYTSAVEIEQKQQGDKLKNTESHSKGIAKSIIRVRRSSVAVQRLSKEEIEKLTNTSSYTSAVEIEQKQQGDKLKNTGNRRSQSDIAREYDRKNNFFPELRPKGISKSNIRVRRSSVAVQRLSKEEIEKLTKINSNKVKDTGNRRSPSDIAREYDRINFFPELRSKGISKSNIHVRRSSVAIQRLSKEEIEKLTNINSNEVKDTGNRRSPSDIAREYDRRNNFFPEPGPSHLNFYALIDVPNPPKSQGISPSNVQSLDIPVSSTQENQKGNTQSTTTSSSSSSFFMTSKKRKHLTVKINEDNNKENENENEDTLIHSFYETSFICDSPSLLSPAKKFGNDDANHCRRISISSNSRRNDDNVLEVDDIPPGYDETLANLSKYNIPEVVNKKPFYSSSRDITGPVEVGDKTLFINGIGVQHHPKAQTQLPSLNSLRSQQRRMAEKEQKGQQQQQGQSRRNINDGTFNSINDELKFRESLCSNRSVIISQVVSAPSFDPVLWRHAQGLKNNETNGNLKTEENENQNSTTLTPLTLSKKLSSSLSLSSSSLKKIAQSPKPHRLSLINYQNQNKVDIFKLTEIEKKFNITHVPIVELKRLDENKLKTVKKDEKERVVLKNFPVSNVNLKKASRKPTKGQKVLSRINESSPKTMSFYEKSFGLIGPTLENSFGYKFNADSLQKAKANIEPNFLTIISLEIFVSTRENLRPNPEFDEIQGLFYAILEHNSVEEFGRRLNKGYIIINPLDDNKRVQNKDNGDDQKSVQNEKQLIGEFLELIYRLDPDILVGYEIEMNSWGYLIERGKYLQMDLLLLLSRVPYMPVQQGNKSKYEGGFNEDHDQSEDYDNEIKITGRILLNIWRLMRSEIALTSYTYENIVFHILHRRVPLNSYQALTKWYKSLNKNEIKIMINYYMERAIGNLEILDKLDLIYRTSEMAKLIGIQFYEVFSRGSQYRVESMMLRLAKPNNYILLSPSIQQRAHMKAPEYLPLILEPESQMYNDPVIVLDFQSLYPSMIIAYNYCYSTCLGRVINLGETETFEFGASKLRVPMAYLKSLIKRDLLNISPCGVAFVKNNVREGILPKMLREILDTRLMVKRSMKLYPDDLALQKILHARQLALKLMANVTYGYTAANFSGRMPCVELGDSIVSKGRETLEKAIIMIKNNLHKWGTEVIYGDTDSMFLLLRDKDKTKAFEIGEEIANSVTNDNPKPVKLKFEKVYQPCILQTKKRYVGYKYESLDQQKPEYEAKGIETVRRDNCPATVKILQRTLIILFETLDVSEVKRYVCSQLTQILSGQVNLQDLIIAKEFRGLNAYKPGACVPALQLAKRSLQVDPRSEPRRGERVPFVIINGPPNLPLIKLVQNPLEFLKSNNQINSLYYITKIIMPALKRCLLLIGADVDAWFRELPRKSSLLPAVISNASKRTIITEYFSSDKCVIGCGSTTTKGICDKCRRKPKKTMSVLDEMIGRSVIASDLVNKKCGDCCRRTNNIECQSLDCETLFRRLGIEKKLSCKSHYEQLINELF